MNLDFVLSVLLDVLIIPLQVILIPFDALLAQIPGIGAIPQALSSILSLIGSIPGTMVNLLGISPFLWNAIFVTFVLYVSLVPGINVFKRLWAWVRP
jgi:hypothetical protein